MIHFYILGQLKTVLSSLRLLLAAAGGEDFVLLVTGARIGGVGLEGMGPEN